MQQIQFNKLPGQKILELGGGDRPHPQADVNVDVRQGPHTHFTADFNEPLPIQSGEFAAVFSQYCIEHLSWRKVKQFVAECFRVLQPGGTAIFVTANTEAQFRFIKEHPEGWDGKDDFESFSCVLFGDQDYPDNTHRNFMSPEIALRLFRSVGFENVVTSAWGDAKTDLVIQAKKPQMLVERVTEALTPASVEKLAERLESESVVPASKGNDLPPPEVLYDKSYWNGGAKFGGYVREGYRDFPVHHVTAAHVLAQKPMSVLELGCARGYVLKRIQDAGIAGIGLEVSKHCHMTRACDGIYQHDLCKTPWHFLGKDKLDLCYSVAVLEHIPEQVLPDLIREMARTCLRGLHGIDFGEKDDGFDKTHVSLFSKAKWEALFAQHAPGWPVTLLDKEELERGELPKDVREGDGKVKVNAGCFMSQFHHGWTNIDVHDLGGWSASQGYKYLRHDVRNGLPFGTGTVDMIFSSHMLEHLSYEEGKRFLRECRRVAKPGCVLRFAVPNARLLNEAYAGAAYRDRVGVVLSDFAEISDGVENAPTDAMKLWELLYAGHQSMYDAETLVLALTEAGFRAMEAEAFYPADFVSEHAAAQKQLLRETIDLPLGGLSLFVAAVPLLG